MRFGQLDDLGHAMAPSVAITAYRRSPASQLGLHRAEEGENALVTATSRPRFVPIVPLAAATERSTLELLRLPWPFSQIGLLTPEEFLKEAKYRRLSMSDGWLLDRSGSEELHRLGILDPLFRLDLAGGTPNTRST